MYRIGYALSLVISFVHTVQSNTAHCRILDPVALSPLQLLLSTVFQASIAHAVPYNFSAINERVNFYCLLLLMSIAWTHLDATEETNKTKNPLPYCVCIFHFWKSRIWSDDDELMTNAQYCVHISWCMKDKNTVSSMWVVTCDAQLFAQFHVIFFSSSSFAPLCLFYATNW